jgi:hypothetical protein
VGAGDVDQPGSDKEGDERMAIGVVELPLPVPDRFMVGLAVLSALAEAAQQRSSVWWMTSNGRGGPSI